jgi:sulfate transport system ATP-binding protein
MEVADRVAILNAGRLEQMGTPQHLHENPASSFVYQFLGETNRFTLVDGGIPDHIPDAARLPAAAAPELYAFARPHEMDVARHPSGELSFESTVRLATSLGRTVRLWLERKDTGEAIEVELPYDKYREDALSVGETVYARPRRYRTFTEGVPG